MGLIEYTNDAVFLPSTYVVAWPDHVWKVGYGCRPERWMRLVNRGAKLIMLEEFYEDRDARQYERVLATAFSYIGTPAFRNEGEARRSHMGSGGGWSECWRIDPRVVEQHAVSYDHLAYWEPGMDDQDWCEFNIFMDAYHLAPMQPEYLPSYIGWIDRPPVRRAKFAPLITPQMFMEAVA